MAWDFAAELGRYGPAFTARGLAPPLAEARAYCARVTATHYENFSVASILLPRRLLPHVRAVYAYCRWADDLADETAGGQVALDLLGWWRCELNACYDGAPVHPVHPVLIALADTVRRFAIPRSLFSNLIAAFEQDQVVRQYDTFEQLLGYCKNSANPVGRIVLHLFGCTDDEPMSLSDDVCTGLQLANFWQDVSRDLAIGRIYLPAEDRRRFGVNEADLSRGSSQSVADLIRYEVDRTRHFFDRGRSLVDLVPREAKLPIALFGLGGEAILAAIAKQGYDVLSQRPVVSKRKKAELVLRAIWQRVRPRRAVR